MDWGSFLLGVALGVAIGVIVGVIVGRHNHDLAMQRSKRDLQAADERSKLQHVIEVFNPRADFVLAVRQRQSSRTDAPSG